MELHLATPHFAGSHSSGYTNLPEILPAAAAAKKKQKTTTQPHEIKQDQVSIFCNLVSGF